MRTGQVRTAQNLLFLLIFRVLKKLTLTICASLSIAFMEKEIFRGTFYKIVLRALFKDGMGKSHRKVLFLEMSDLKEL